MILIINLYMTYDVTAQLIYYNVESAKREKIYYNASFFITVIQNPVIIVLHIYASRINLWKWRLFMFLSYIKHCYLPL